MRPNTLDTIRVLKSLPEGGVKAGTVGVIIAIFDDPDEACEVESSGEVGRPIPKSFFNRKILS